MTLLKYGTFLIICLVPFYTFFTTWIALYTGNLLLLRGWKELLLLLLTVVVAYIVLCDKKFRSRLFRDKLLWFIVGLGAWTVASGLFLVKDFDSGVLGLAIQLRSFLFFLVAAAVAYYHRISEATLIKLVTVPAVGVVAFGLLQIFVLPQDFLKHFGYQKGVTTPPYFTIDEQVDRIRIFSTLRGPNPLGVYLIAPFMLFVTKVKSSIHKNKHFFLTIFYILLTLTVLYASHSRSAWIGLIIAIIFLIWLYASKTWKLLLVILSCTALLIGGGVIYQYRHTNFVQDVVLHDNPEEGGEVSSNQGRIEAFSEAKKDIVRSPVWGCGVGCAGPASVHNNNEAKLAENFYLQTIQELGIVGFMLLITIHALVFTRLLKRGTIISNAWAAVFIGVSIASLLSHAWADDTITYIWWGVAGLLIGVYSHSGSGIASATHRRTSE